MAETSTPKQIAADKVEATPMTDKYAKLREAAEKATPELIRDVATIQDLINSTDWREKTTSPKNANQAKQRCQAAWFRIRERVESAETAIWHSHANIERATALEADLAAEKARADAAEALLAEAYGAPINWMEVCKQRVDATLTAERDALIRERDNAAYLLRLITEWPTASHELTYTNYRGETSVRVLHLVRIWLGSTEWHPEPQLLLKAFDTQKDAYRDFAVKDFDIPDARSALTNANAAEREGNAPFVFASRHNDATGECEPVEISPEKARRIYEKIATRRTPETKP